MVVWDTIAAQSGLPLAKPPPLPPPPLCCCPQNDLLDCISVNSDLRDRCKGRAEHRVRLAGQAAGVCAHKRQTRWIAPNLACRCQLQEEGSKCQLVCCRGNCELQGVHPAGSREPSCLQVKGWAIVTSFKWRDLMCLIIKDAAALVPQRRRRRQRQLACFSRMMQAD